MVRILNFAFVAAMGLSILALYDVSERTRLAHVALTQASRDIAHEQERISVLQTEWEHVANPERIATLAQSKLALDNRSSAQLASVQELPRNGDESPLSSSPVRNANAEAPAQ
ncbi:MAG: hypothetical protein JO261_13090 [Alphaproteobacteria bacterium]|nr:hypothetical protein [Alphaproteobacteria bacterium]MBV9694628.1 hypothetical protein [Alphaproteobacteria bacterium]